VSEEEFSKSELQVVMQQHNLIWVKLYFHKKKGNKFENLTTASHKG